MTGVALTELKGIGQKRQELFRAQGICDTNDLLSFLPRTYSDYTRATPVALLKSGQNVAVRVRLDAEPRLARFHGMSVVSVRAHDETGALTVKWFNQPYRKSLVAAGQTVILCGRADCTKGRSMQNPSVHDALPGFVPIYPSLPGLTQHTVREAVRAALALTEKTGALETLPEWIRRRFSLCPLAEAYRNAHFPEEEASLAAAIRRLSFESALGYLLAVESERAERKRISGFAFDCSGAADELTQKLPFALTRAQERAIGELKADLEQPCPMNRLLQGDVGSGKTAVAAYALLVAARNSYQGALLAPTEVLAEQHYETLSEWFGAEAVCLLTGSMPKKTRVAALARIADGTAQFIVGTHALLQQEVCFSRLGIVVTDEQHRFGVLQRAAIAGKGVRPDVLVMSATPIPRTLALILYGDLDVSMLDEMPPGRLPVRTSYISGGRRLDMYRYIGRQLKQGNSAFVVCPVIEESDGAEVMSAERAYAEISQMLPDTPAALLHGKLRSKEKHDIIDRFRTGEIRLLVSTTVIEVGVHVPSANIMVIESADRFGLAQLHQLRGRVGRGNAQAYCFLLADDPGETAVARFDALKETNDGFLIAERDLTLRGYGDLLGTRQHGDGEIGLLAAIQNVQLLKAAQTAAHEVLSVPSVENNALLARAKEKYLALADMIAMN